MDFSNKNILITGGSRGIGRACAQLFSELNANVIITYKSNKKEADITLNNLKSPGKHKAYAMDMSTPSDIDKVFKLIIDEYKSLDVLVNNAGIYIEHKLLEVNYEEWQKFWEDTMQTNLTGVSNLCFLAAKHMVSQGEGKIVNISSRGAFRGEPNHPAYGASKAGMNSFSQSLAQYLAPHNVRVTVVAPGFVETDMAHEYLHGKEGDKILQQSPLNRAATPDEIAKVVAFSASEGVDYMTGGIIDVNGASYLRT